MYWPYATTLFDYTRRAMPQTTPGTLSDDEVYAVVAYVLHLNGLVPADAVLDAASLAAIEMPARERFVPDDRTGGPVGAVASCGAPPAARLRSRGAATYCSSTTRNTRPGSLAGVRESQKSYDRMKRPVLERIHGSAGY